MSDELYSTVNYIKNKVDAIEKIEMLNLRSNKNLLEEYSALLKKDKLLFRVYKEIDGTKSQKDIAKIVESSNASVTYKIQALIEKGLVEINAITTKNERIYKHSIAEKAFNLTKLEI